jgi:hypothetical protein
MALQAGDFGSRARVPHTRRFVCRRRHDPAAIRTERRARDIVFMTLEARDLDPCP